VPYADPVKLGPELPPEGIAGLAMRKPVKPRSVSNSPSRPGPQSERSDKLSDKDIEEMKLKAAKQLEKQGHETSLVDITIIDEQTIMVNGKKKRKKKKKRKRRTKEGGVGETIGEISIIEDYPDPAISAKRQPEEVIEE
jgi:hypothetical protein